MAYRLAKRTGRNDVCALPSGISVPHMFIVTFVIMLPIALKTNDPIQGWEAGLVWVFFQSFILMIGVTGWPGGRDPRRTKPGDAPVRPLRSPSAGVFPKRILVLSPHPDDDVIGMGGTLCRLVEHGHEVHVAYQVSGANAVSDEALARALRFVRDRASQPSPTPSACSPCVRCLRPGVRFPRRPRSPTGRASSGARRPWGPPGSAASLPAAFIFWICPSTTQAPGPGGSWGAPTGRSCGSSWRP